MARILIIDDSDLSRRIVRTILEGAGHEITEASEGKAALDQYSRLRPHLIILDIVLSGMDGMDVLKCLIEIDPGAKVIILSADVQKLTRLEGMQLGAAAFLTKPIDPQMVLKAVGEISKP
jgi:two-component system chemotaxis response regulator CheY